jgi:glycosyltransferase involved in cell wall biosynthesis
MNHHSKIHICVTDSPSGIADYARDFQRIVLENEGYVLCDPRDLPTPEALGSAVQFHVQLGVHQQLERQAVDRLLNAGCRAIDATIHDPPFTAFPYYAFASPFLTRMSRGFDWYLRSFGRQRRMLERLQRVFVLSEHGKAAIRQIAPKANICTIPHIIDKAHIWDREAALGEDLLYFGFIGPNKGLDYVLEVHQQLRRWRPEVRLHVVGKPANDAAMRYFHALKQRFVQGVTYHGYVPNNQLDELFAQAAHVMLPYGPYRHIAPTSGSAIHALRRGRIVWATPVNAIPELISDGENGFLLTGDLAHDARRIAQVIDDPHCCREISNAARNTAIRMAEFPYRDFF